MPGEMVSLADVKFPSAHGVTDTTPDLHLGSRLDRRSFLKCALIAGTACGMGAFAEPCAALLSRAGGSAQSDVEFTVEAKFYEKLQNKKIKCKLCPRECVVGDRERGYCGVRENREGKYYTLVHSRVCAAHIDPIEKKPLFHYLPGTLAFSLATAGCNVNCKFCQNWDVSQVRPEQVRADYAPPQKVAELAKQYHCPSIAYTYSEPVVFSEYLMDTADAGHDAGVRSVVVSNGYIQTDSLKAAYGKMDAVKIDLKAFSESYYRDVVVGELKPVLDCLVTLRKMGKWTEIVYLVVPTLNDSDSEFRGLVRWIKTNLGVDVPVHFTQFHPEYLLKNLPITPVPTLERAKAIADAEGLHYVYIGNVPGHPAENTYCPKCRHLLVERMGMTTSRMLIRKGSCPFCKQPIPGIWHA
jgi:pyruvate formate lyase activating enzyme